MVNSIKLDDLFECATIGENLADAVTNEIIVTSKYDSVLNLLYEERNEQEGVKDRRMRVTPSFRWSKMDMDSECIS